jgi:hypothetical protein
MKVTIYKIAKWGYNVFMANRYSIMFGLVLAAYVGDIRTNKHLNDRINEVVSISGYNDSITVKAVSSLIESTNSQIRLDGTILERFRELYHQDTVIYTRFEDIKREIRKTDPGFKYSKPINGCKHND